mmetsp:Transcript_64066/g.111677  ORF Transcript_64066/g.111677 Transcript_64066/m.111677 type:complete len:226 (+) Transcript_64066:71-748(+)
MSASKAVCMLLLVVFIAIAMRDSDDDSEKGSLEVRSSGEKGSIEVRSSGHQALVVLANPAKKKAKEKAKQFPNVNGCTHQYHGSDRIFVITSFTDPCDKRECMNVTAEIQDPSVKAIPMIFEGTSCLTSGGSLLTFPGFQGTYSAGKYIHDDRAKAIVHNGDYVLTLRFADAGNGKLRVERIKLNGGTGTNTDLFFTTLSTNSCPSADTPEADAVTPGEDAETQA